MISTRKMFEGRLLKTNNCLNYFFETKRDKGDLGHNLIFMQKAQLFPWKQVEQLCK